MGIGKTTNKRPVRPREPVVYAAYDAAHRLTGMADRKGNHVITTLDVAGKGSYLRPETTGAISGLTGTDSRYANPTLLDINLDGRLDLFAPEANDHINSGKYHLINTGVATGTCKGITIELTGKNKAAPSSGKDAFGARVQVTAGGITQTRQVLPGMGNARRLHFGLGTATSGISIKIFWPHSTIPQTLSGDAYRNSILRVTQP